MSKIIKKTTALLLVLFTVFALGGCSNNSQNQNTVSLEDQYYAYAEECIEKGEKENAVAALEEGIEKTNSDKLKQLLETLKSDGESSSSETTSAVSSSVEISSEAVVSKETEEKEKFKIPDTLLTVLNSTRAKTFGSKPYDFTSGGSECYYSDDMSFVVYYSLDGPSSEKPAAIEGEIEALIPGKSTYTATEIQKIFSGYKCKKSYSEINESYSINISYENYQIGFSASSMNNYTSFFITRM